MKWRVVREPSNAIVIECDEPLEAMEVWREMVPTLKAGEKLRLLDPRGKSCGAFYGPEARP